MRRDRIATSDINETFDPSLWSITVVLGAAVVYLACLA